MRQSKFFKTEDSFTLVELLVVIGILAILTAAVVIVLNPAELLKQSRDSKRTTDLANLNNAIKLLLTQNPDVNLGSASTVYMSLADSSSTCGSYALPALPSGWKYQCATSANYQKADGSGWLPVSFAAAGAVAALPSLPVDPQNTVQNYYSYVSGGSWQLSTVFESSKYAAKEASDGGANLASYEVGSNLSLAPFAGGLIGYWKFDESAGTTAYDSSGYGANGAMYASTTPAYIDVQSGCKRGGCLSLNGIDRYVAVDGPAAKGRATFFIWANPASCPSQMGMLTQRHSGNFHGRGIIISSDFYYYAWSRDASYTWNSVNLGQGCQIGQWHSAAFVQDGNTLTGYLDGVKKGTVTMAGNIGDAYLGYYAIGKYTNADLFFSGLLDEAQVYNRALSDAEIRAIHDATK
jgi:type II secretory pathway pseudopilin PulG